MPSARETGSRGARDTERSECDGSLPEPQGEIYLVAGPFVEYVGKAGTIETMVFLRKADEMLAGKYLQAATEYLAMYEQLLGPYPYGKFALVENLDQTGFGMPSFTLLGSKVIRLPFLLYTSYPHEILHNWWGNGVYPDYEKGNWSEGLTAYLSDHLIQEQHGRARTYRQDTLQRYADYVFQGKDFPLTRFTARHSAASQAVGYGKALMFFHMLRQKLGDAAFVGALRHFYGHNRFRIASYDDLRMSFEAVSGTHLKPLFDQWLTRVGAPELKIRDVQGRSDGTGYRLTGSLDQVQPGDAYALRVPIAITLEGGKRVHWKWVSMESKQCRFYLQVPAKPLRVDVDPRFDLFRKPADGETPIALSKAFGTERMLIIIPSKARPELVKAYEDLAESWNTLGPRTVEVKLDSQVEKLPVAGTVVVLGWENLFLAPVKASLAQYDVKVETDAVNIGTRSVPRSNHSIALAVTDQQHRGRVLLWGAGESAASIEGLARKAPHYGKYGYVAFKGSDSLNLLKGRWPVTGSALTVLIPDRDGTVLNVGMAGIEPRKPLVAMPGRSSSPVRSHCTRP